jgi:hypothetical protein
LDTVVQLVERWLHSISPALPALAASKEGILTLAPGLIVFNVVSCDACCVVGPVSAVSSIKRVGRPRRGYDDSKKMARTPALEEGT